MAGDSYTVTYPIAGSDVPTYTYVQVGPVPGEPCPTCGRKVPMTGAERQRKWRARKAADYVVNSDGTGDFETIQEAVDAAEQTRKLQESQ